MGFSDHLICDYGRTVNYVIFTDTNTAMEIVHQET